MDQSIKEKIIDIAKELLEKVGFDADIKFVETESGDNKLATLSLDSGSDLSMLIGKNGQNLGAFEHLLKVLVFKKLNETETTTEGNPANFTVDINDYRKSKANYLIEFAKNIAQRVIQTQRAESLAPMTAYERRLVHMELASYKELQTESIGQEPRRRVVIKPALVA